MNEKMKDFQIEQRETKEFFTGSYGLVIKPDQDTTERAKLLARSLAPNAPFLVENPHITLFHAKFANLPNNEVRGGLQAINNLRGQPLKLRDLQIFGGKFLFWNVVKNDQIQQAHEQALKLSQYLDQEAQARALEEGLSLTEQELESLRRFGHPLMNDLYLPHITLAYDPNGITLDPKHIAEEYDMQVDSVNFAEIGQYGIVKNIIELDGSQKIIDKNVKLIS